MSVDGQKVVVAAKTSVEDLAQGLSKVQEKGERTRDTLIKFNQAALAFQNLSASFQQITSLMSSYTQAYNVQLQAETQLSTVMRERMNATEGDIAAIATQPHVKKKLEPKKLLPFPWEKPRKPKAEVVSREEARKRFERLMRKS